MMASACVNNIGMTPENFLDCPTFPSYGWLSPRISFSRDLVDDGTKIAGEKSPAGTPAEKHHQVPLKNPDPDACNMDLIDFEFRLDNPVAMLPADELFYDGKLVPLQLASVRPPVDSAASSSQIRSPEVVKSRRRLEICSSDPYLFSPKAPRCSSRWRELLGLKKIQNPKSELQKATSAAPSKNPNSKSLKHFLHRNGKSPADSSMSLPLLRDSDSESVSISSRLSLSSSSSSGLDHEDLPRLSLDSDKANPSPNPISLNRNPPRVRVSKPRTPIEKSRSLDRPIGRMGRSPMRRARDPATIPARGVSVDSPRMNSSGKIVFQSLERSSSSPSTFHAGPRNTKHRGMERSYSANLRVTPVLNVPVCTLRGSSVFGLGQLFSPQKRDAAAKTPMRARAGERN